jgi:hypothetical protein
MPTLSASSSVSQSGLQQMRLQQAVRNADQAEQNARSLRNQADSAQRVAAQAQEGARAISIQAGQAQDRAGQARQSVAAQESYAITSTQLGEIYTGVAEKLQVVDTPVAVAAPTVVNAQGQVTGGNVNVTA